MRSWLLSGALVAWAVAMLDQMRRILVWSEAMSSSERTAWILAVGGGVATVLTVVGNRFLDLWVRWRKLDEGTAQGHLAACQGEIALKDERIRVLTEQIAGLVDLKDARIKAMGDEKADLIGALGRKDVQIQRDLKEKDDLLAANDKLIRSNAQLTDRIASLASQVALTNTELAHKVKSSDEVVVTLTPPDPRLLLESPP